MTTEHPVLIKSSGIRFINLFFRFLTEISFAPNGNKKRKKQNEKRCAKIDLFTPWYIELDCRRKLLHIRKRNWYFIGVDSQSYSFNKIRNVIIDEHVFTSDVSIKVFSGQANACYIGKRQARYLKENLLKEMTNTKTKEEWLD